ncbi:MAG: bifunctional metallophosphatase/5'-nucleotidase [Lachnospiraceae bacterium]|nr:bifunctional metallophosphatase/5'-nucleotidase [Lachnospiraceae bacterium]
MKKRICVLTALFTAVILAYTGMMMYPARASEAGKSTGNNGKNTGNSEGPAVGIIFTHDIHSYLERYELRDGDKTIKVGGMPALSAYIKERKKEDPEILVLDGGDIAMGTLYQTLYSEEAPELKMLGLLGFDATTFGNHEFDYGSKALADMFYSAAESGYGLPEYLICNIDRTADNEGTRLIFTALDETCGVKEYDVFERNGVRIAVTGVLGKEAYSDAPGCELVWLDPIESLKKTVAKIQAEENCDMIVCISHSGTSPVLEQSEDEQIAIAVPELDLIISAHSHTIINEPLHYGNTWIVGCGCYGEYTGDLRLIKRDDGRWDMAEYSLVRMTEDIKEDPEVAAVLEGYKKDIENMYLETYGYDLERVIAQNDIKFESVDDIYAHHLEQRLGNLFSDAYLFSANSTKDGKEHPADFSIAPSGTIRSSVPMGDITADDIFQMYSLGMGYDGKVGNPLIKIYLKGDELYTLSEIDASIGASLKTAAKLYYSGLGVTFNPHRLFLNKTTDVYLMPDPLKDEREEIDPDRLYCAVTDLYSGQMLGAVSGLSKGLIKIEPKDVSGNVLPLDEHGNYDYSSVVVRDDNGEELKTWVAIARYLDSFEDHGDGISDVPDYYETSHGRKNVEYKSGIGAVLSHPNRYVALFALLILAVIIVAALLIFLIVKLIKTIIKRRGMIKKAPKE